MGTNDKGAGFLFTDGDTILLLKRNAKGESPEKWATPGGKQETGESFLDTAIRETKEETGRVPEYKIISQIDTHTGDFTFRTFIASTKRFNCELSGEHTAYDWFPLDNVDKADLHPKLKEIIERVKTDISKYYDNKLNFKEFVSRS